MILLTHLESACVGLRSFSISKSVSSVPHGKSGLTATLNVPV